jgi:hypothetical protein
VHFDQQYTTTVTRNCPWLDRNHGALYKFSLQTTKYLIQCGQFLGLPFSETKQRMDSLLFLFIFAIKGSHDAVDLLSLPGSHLSSTNQCRGKEGEGEKREEKGPHCFYHSNRTDPKKSIILFQTCVCMYIPAPSYPNYFLWFLSLSLSMLPLFIFWLLKINCNEFYSNTTWSKITCTSKELTFKFGFF